MLFIGIDSLHLKKGQYPSFMMTRYGQFGQHLSEFVLGYIIAVERSAFYYHDKQKEGKW